jgi:hypothetical protein
MYLTHYGKDYGPDIAGLPDAELQALQITSRKHYLLPSNPVITKAEHPVRIAFFGINAYSKDSDFEKVQQQNFTEWCQDNYKSKTELFTVLQLWHDGLPNTYFTDDSAIYFSNFVKIVLREKFQDESGHEKSFVKGETVKKTLKKNCDESLTLFKELAKQEVTELSNNGCRLFICFGNIVYDFMRKIIRDSGNIILIKEIHFSYWRISNEDREKHTKKLIQSTISRLEQA